MKKPITKKKVSLTLDKTTYDYLYEKYSNKSKYLECLIYNDLKNRLKKEIII
jgi:hypothetical protein